MKLALIVAAFFVFGCSSTTARKTSPQVGVMTAQDAIRQWGAPTQQRKTADGGTEMVWRSGVDRTLPQEYVHPRGPTYGGTAARGGETLTALFDRNGVLKGWNSRP